jgi:DNA-binding CsgD family transcriptional regulator
VKEKDLDPKWFDRALPVRLIPLGRDEIRNSLYGASAGRSGNNETILELLGQGLSTKSIARRLGLSTRTIQRRVSLLRETFGASTNTELVVKAIEQRRGV